MKEELVQYRVEPDSFWQELRASGYDGYGIIEASRRWNWHVIAAWGQEGWNLGEWPYVIVFFQNREQEYRLVLYVEGDITEYACPTRDLRNAVCDEIAFFYWKHGGESWVKEYDSAEQAPDELRGPYSFSRHG